MKYMDWDNMHTRLEALYILDNALTDPSEDDLRLVRKRNSTRISNMLLITEQEIRCL